MNRVKNNYRFNQCPLCTSEAIYCMGKISYLKQTKFSTIEIDLEFVPELWKCKQCLSAFVLNIIQEGIAKKLYTNGLAGDRWSMQKFNQNKMQNVVEYMEDAFNNKCRILDIGSNTGELLDFAKNFGCNTVGLEFSSSSREILINKGHEAYSSFGEIEGKFDFITAFDLVEHLYDVPNFLKTLDIFLFPSRREGLPSAVLEAMSCGLPCVVSQMDGIAKYIKGDTESILIPQNNEVASYVSLVSD